MTRLTLWEIKEFMQKIVDFAKKITDEDLKPENIKKSEHPLYFLTVSKQEEFDMIQDMISAAKDV